MVKFQIKYQILKGLSADLNTTIIWPETKYGWPKQESNKPMLRAACHEQTEQLLTQRTETCSSNTGPYQTRLPCTFGAECGKWPLKTSYLNLINPEFTHFLHMILMVHGVLYGTLYLLSFFQHWLQYKFLFVFQCGQYKLKSYDCVIYTFR